MTFLYRFYEKKSLIRTTTRECHIDLSMSKRSVPDIDQDSIKRLSLRLMDRDRPGELHGKLCECPDHRWSDDPCDRIWEKVIYLPGIWFDQYLISCFSLYLEYIISILVFFIPDDFGDRTIDPAISSIIRDEHDLGTELQCEFYFCRELFLIDRSEDIP